MLQLIQEAKSFMAAQENKLEENLDCKESYETVKEILRNTSTENILDLFIAEQNQDTKTLREKLSEQLEIQEKKNFYDSMSYEQIEQKIAEFNKKHLKPNQTKISNKLKETLKSLQNL